MRRLAVEHLEKREMLSAADVTIASESFLGERWGITQQEWSQAECVPNLHSDAEGTWWLYFEDRKLSLCKTEAKSIREHYGWERLWPDCTQAV